MIMAFQKMKCLLLFVGTLSFAKALQTVEDKKFLG
jgi:hypothetical protein